MSSPGAPSTPSYSAGHSTHPSNTSGPSTPPTYSSGPSTPTNYSLGSSRNRECSNCKHLRGKISVLKATMEMHMHPEQHTVNSAALFHEVTHFTGGDCCVVEISGFCAIGWIGLQFDVLVGSSVSLGVRCELRNGAVCDKTFVCWARVFAWIVRRWRGSFSVRDGWGRFGYHAGIVLGVLQSDGRCNRNDWIVCSDCAVLCTSDCSKETLRFRLWRLELKVGVNGGGGERCVAGILLDAAVVGEGLVLIESCDSEAV
ncbi:hypothetical protein Tco_0052463 [Tanacetum coccineum]